MRKIYLLVLAAFLLGALALEVSAQNLETSEPTEVWEPVPRVVTVEAGKAPSDAIVLFNGENLDEWEHVLDQRPVEWEVKDQVVTVKPGAGDIRTKKKFGDCQLHLEWRTPLMVNSDGQGRGNSGIFFMERYEIQILDGYMNSTYSNGQAASVFKQHIPLVNACLPPGTWQSYDIIFTAPVFNDDGIKVKSGRVTVIQNGVVVQNNVEIKGTTQYIGMPQNEAHGDEPILLEDRGNPVSFYNIWVREL